MRLRCKAEFFICKLVYKEKTLLCILKGQKALTYWHGGYYCFFLNKNMKIKHRSLLVTHFSFNFEPIEQDNCQGTGERVAGYFTCAAVVLFPCANELQGAVELGILTGSIEERDVKIDFYVGGDTLCFDDFLVEGEGGH